MLIFFVILNFKTLLSPKKRDWEYFYNFVHLHPSGDGYIFIFFLSKKHRKNVEKKFWKAPNI